MANKMTNLPPSWSIARLGEIAEIKGGKRLPKGDKYSDTKTKFPYIRVVDFEKMTVNLENLQYLTQTTYEKIKNYIICKDDLYISIAGTIGRVGCIPNILDKANLTENAAKITNLKKIDLKFLCHYLNSHKAQVDFVENTISTTQPKLALFRISQINVPLPPLPEQHRIFTKLEELFSQLDTAVATLKKAKEQIKTYKQSVLSSAFCGKLTMDNGQLKINKETGLPEGWKWVTFNDICTKIGDVDHKMPKVVKGGYPYLSTKDFTNDFKISFENAKEISEEDYIQLSKKIKPEKWDIIFPRYGTIGKNILIEIDIDFLVSYSCAIIKPNRDIVSPKYLYYYSHSPIIKKEIDKYIVETTQANIGIASINRFVFPLPKAKIEQEQIVSEIETRFSEAENLEKTIELSLKQAESLRQSILKKAFEGRLVPQDPNDEPAEKLLERIKKENLTVEKSNRKKSI